jgi:hypothetical protein
MPDPTRRRDRRRWTLLATTFLAVLAVVTAGLGVVASPAQAAAHRIALRVLVVSSGDAATVALTSELDRQGVPYTRVTPGAAGRPTIDAEFLEDAATGTARYQAVFLPNQAGGGLAAAELGALAAYEAAYGVRQVNGYDFPVASMGAVTAASGWLDGSAATVTPAGLAGPFGYLRGPLTIEDADAAIGETFGYLARALSPMPAGESFTPLVTATSGGTTGSILGVHTTGGREELVVSASFNASMQWFNVLAEGIVAWATRGIHLGYDRNYLNVHIDDVFLPDSRWSAEADCTPGDNCVDPTVTTTDIRMVPADVTRLVNWQQANGLALDMVFNGGGVAAAAAESATGSDPLAVALLANKAQFPWVNHTLTHPYLGCIQIAPSVATGAWRCATSPLDAPRFDPEVPGTMSGNIYWASQSFITQQVSDNIAFATANALPRFDPAELVTGEHSGLASEPQQPADNPFLAPALAAAGIRYTASDASREPDQRTLAGGTTATVPRHPMNIFYNAGTYRDEVDEYNWIYTSTADGGSGICTANPQTSTCITPLPAADPAQARASFENYITPIEVRNALRYVLTNDPRPFYAHQSNLAEDGILYPVLDGILATYRTAYDTTRTPLVQTSLSGQHQALSRLSTWRAASRAAGFTDGYLDSSGVHLPSSSVAVPLTVPAGSTGAPALQPYGGALSGWLAGGAVVVPPTPGGGYTISPAPTTPPAPTGASAVAGSTVATVSWTAPVTDGGSPLTGYAVRVYSGTSTTPSRTLTTDPSATSLLVTGLTNGTSYRFDVAAVNAIGTGPASATTTAVTPSATLAPVPTGVTGQPGNASATVRWSAATAAGVDGYRVRAYAGTSTSATSTVTVGAGQRVAAVSGLKNGQAYTFTVNAVTGGANGADSQRSAAVTPSLSDQTDVAPAVTGVTAGNKAVTVEWAEPVEPAGTTATGYRVEVYTAGTTKLARGVTVDAPATRSLTVTGLGNGKTYDVQVIVRTAAGNGPASARSAAVTPQPTAPAAPAIGPASAGAPGGSVTATATWSAPSSSGGSKITGYVVIATQLDASGAVVGTTSSPLLKKKTRPYTMTLPAVGSYQFSVVAHTAVGAGPQSDASNLVTGQ